MSKKLTPWFPDNSKPVHVGEYETRWIMNGPQRMRHWNGEYWCHSRTTECCSLQNFYWRGLAKKPK